MPYTPTHIPDLLILEPKVFGDTWVISKEDWFVLA